MQCTTCHRQTDTEDRRCNACGGLMVDADHINHQHTVAIRSQIQPLRAMLAGCTSPEQRKSLRGQIAELNRQAVQP